MPNESHSGNSFYGDGIYYHEKAHFGSQSFRRRLLSEYINSRDEHDECGCRFELDSQSHEIQLTDKLDRCYRQHSATNEELPSISSPTSTQLLLQKRRRRLRRRSRRPQRQPRLIERAKQSELPDQIQQQVTGITSEGSAFTRFITPAVDEPERTQLLCSLASVGQDETSVSSTAATFAIYQPVAHRQHRHPKSISDREKRQKQQHYSITKREQSTRLFIDDSESVQSSSIVPAGDGCCCCWQCFAENNNNNYESSDEQHQKIYEPRPKRAPGAIVETFPAYCQQVNPSWPCYPSQATTGLWALATPHRNVLDNPSIRPVRATHFHSSITSYRDSQLLVSTAIRAEELTPESDGGSDEDDESEVDLDKFDTRSALDCVEEYSPTWSDLSSVQIENSDQILDSREQHEEGELACGASATNFASCWNQMQKMEEDGIRDSQEKNNNNNNNVASERQFGFKLEDNSNYEIEARLKCARPPSLGQENYFASYQTNKQLDEKQEASDKEPRRQSDNGQFNRKTKTKIQKQQQQKQQLQQQQRTRRKKRERVGSESVHKKQEELTEQQEQQRQATVQSECECESESASMRAARDLAKLSVPSLSSLQYLPSQIDVKPAKMVDEKASQVRSASARISVSSGPTRSASKLSQANVNSQEIDVPLPQSISAHARETAKLATDKTNAKHDESCLLGRLCMCNCMAAKKAKSEAPTGTIQTSRPQRTFKSRARSSSASDTGPKSSQASDRADERASPVSLSDSVDLHEDENVMPSARVDCEQSAPSTSRHQARGSSPLPRAGGNVVTVRDDSVCSREKQSPTFLGLLRPAAQRAIGVKKQKTSRGQTLEAAKRPTKQFAIASSKVLGSIDDLEVSGRSSSSASGSQPASDFCSPPLSSRSTNSSKFASSKDKPRLSHIKSSAAWVKNENISSRQDNNETDSTRNSSCRNCNSPTGTNQHIEKRKPAYKRLLSPSKLFHNSTSSHSSICEDCKPEPSFLSRSLSRLSGRSPSGDKHKRASPVPIAGDQHTSIEEGAQQQLPARLSPSISNHSHLDDTYRSDSINSLEEEINFCHSLPYEVNLRVGPETPSRSSTRLLRTPEIILSRVEFQDLPEDLECSSCQTKMTRSTSGLGQQHRLVHPNGRHSSCRNHDHQLYERAKLSPTPQRHASEISFQTTSDGSTSLTHGPFSLPASPRASRRHGHRHSASQSPRLCSSPVSFHSPASQSSKIEDGLSVCSTGHFEKHIGNIKGNQIEAQKHLFTAWINHYAPNLIMRDLFVELQDGIKLIGLLATLTRDRRLLTEYERLNRDKQTYVNRLALTPSSRLTHISNVHMAIDYMRTTLGMKLVNLNPMDIVSGKENVILGLCWNIILHFQLSRDLLSSAGSEGSSSPSCSVGSRTSHLSADQVRAQRAGSRKSLPGRGGQSHLLDELSSKDLVAARSKLLAHINKRFNLKLTKLTSSLLDGDVLLAIIKQLVSPASSSELHDDLRLSNWHGMDDNQQLDVCFQLAQDYLNVPWLISASDLRRETLNERNSKPLLVYLSMLLKANLRDCPTGQMFELRQLEKSLKEGAADGTPRMETAEQQETSDICEEKKKKEPVQESDQNLILNCLYELDMDDKFHIDKLQTTLGKLNRLNELIESTRDGWCKLEEPQRVRIDKLRRQIAQVDSLISWINEADKLFEAKQEASCDLARSTQLYDQSVVFFAPSNLPQLDTSLCPTLERQYRECLASARQHILSLEQIMKNWISHREATKELKDWLIRAELKLESALRPNGNHLTNFVEDKPEFGSDQQIDQQKSRLEDLIEFFELEQIERDDFDMLSPSINNPFASLDSNGRLSSLSNIDQSEHSLSGSMLSLGSTSSRMSTLVSSKRAAHHGLFENLELQSRLLAATLDEPEQRDSILMGVKTFNMRVKQILDHKVPQVISDICLSINRCKMQIKEQEDDEDEDEDEAKAELENLNDELATLERAESPIEQEHPSIVSDQMTADKITIGQTSSESPESIVGPPSSPTTQKSSRNNSPSPVSPSKLKRQKRKIARAQRSKNSNNQKENDNGQIIGRLNVLGKILPKVKVPASAGACSDDSECEPFYRSLWHKIVRASKVSLSFNIVLLICLAGICVMPLIQKDACCELNQTPIPTERFTVNQRPT